ncbi:MAG: hypothetical protein WAZ64_01925, partial [Candidatus Moraniibacteriota bacterium]
VRVIPENFEKFCTKMTELIEAELENKETISRLLIDLEIRASEINWEFMEELKKMEPFGMGNKEPVFMMKDMQISDVRAVGNGSKHLKLTLKATDNSPKLFEAIAFKLGEKFSDLKKGDNIDIVFNLQEDSWNGNKKIQLNIIDLKNGRA